jgi:hypothetical protein
MLQSILAAPLQVLSRIASGRPDQSMPRWFCAEKTPVRINPSPPATSSKPIERQQTAPICQQDFARGEMAGNWQSISGPHMGAQQVLRPQCLEDEQQISLNAQNMQGQFWNGKGAQQLSRQPSTAAEQQSAQNMQGAQPFWDEQAVSCQEQFLENGASLYPRSFAGSQNMHPAEQARFSLGDAQLLTQTSGQDSGARPYLVNMQHFSSGLAGQAEPSTEGKTVSVFFESQDAPGNQFEMRFFTPQQPQGTGSEGKLAVGCPQVGAFSEGPSPLIGQENGGPEFLLGPRNVQTPIGGAQERSGEMQVNLNGDPVPKQEAVRAQQGSELSPLAVQLSRFIMSGYERTPPGETPQIGRPSAPPALQLPPQAAGFGCSSPERDPEPFYQWVVPGGDSTPLQEGLSGEEKANAEEQILKGQDLSSHSPRHVSTYGQSEGGHFANRQDLSGQALHKIDGRFASAPFPGEQSRDADVSTLQPPGVTLLTEKPKEEPVERGDFLDGPLLSGHFQTWQREEKVQTAGDFIDIEEKVRLVDATYKRNFSSPFS